MDRVMKFLIILFLLWAVVYVWVAWGDYPIVVRDNVVVVRLEPDDHLFVSDFSGGWLDRVKVTRGYGDGVSCDYEEDLTDDITKIVIYRYNH